MATTLEIRDAATPELRRIRAGLSPQRIDPVLARGAVNVTRQHLFDLDRTRPNLLGGTRTHFFAQAARGTNFSLESDGFSVGISQVGFRQRLQGGTIRPKTAKFLTIPARAEAYGKRAREFNDLRFAITSQGPALVTVASTSVRRFKKGFRATASNLGDQVMFYLRRSVTQRPDPSVLPTKERFEQELTKVVDDYARHLAARGGNN